MTNRVTVLGPAGSTYVCSVRIALREKGVEHELVQLPLPAYKQDPYVADHHPFGKAPAFEHDGFRLYESQAILRYIDEAFSGPALQPADLRERARMNQIMGIVDAYAHPSIAGGVLWNRFLAPRLGIPVDEAAVEAALPRARTCLAEVERLMGDRPYLAGGTLSLADILVLPILVYFAETAEGEAVMAPRAAVRAWIERVAALPNVASVLAEGSVG